MISTTNDFHLSNVAEVKGNHGSMRANLMKLVLLIFQYLLGTFFLVSGIAKVNAPFIFLEDVIAYRLLGEKMAVATAALLPWIEVVFGACLLIGVALDGALLGIVLLSHVFIAAQLWALYNGYDIDCGCGGGWGGSVGFKSISKTVTIGVVSVTSYYLLVRQKRPRVALGGM